MKKLIIVATIFISTFADAQDSTKINPLTVSGYAEIYYSYDFNNPLNNTKPSFIYSHNRNNEMNLNLGFIKASYITQKKSEPIYLLLPALILTQIIRQNPAY